MDAVVLKVEGMNCGHCKMTVEKAAKNVAGVTAAEVDLAAKQLTLNGSFDQAEVVKAIEEAGFHVVA